MSLDCSGNVSGGQLEWRQPSVAQIWIIESPATREEKEDFMNSKTSKTDHFHKSLHIEFLNEIDWKLRN